MRLLRHLADEGMTIVVVTHTLANVIEFCDKIVCMGRGGHATFVGAPSEALDFFAVRRLGEVFSRMDEQGAECWRARFEQITGAAPVVVNATSPRHDPHTAHEPGLVTALVASRRIGRQSCCAAIEVRTHDNQDEKAFCRLRRREGGARPEARATEELA